MIAALDLQGNASSVHAEGRKARAVVETAREQVAALLHASPADVVFTSSATEANNAVLNSGWETIYVAEIEHESVLAGVACSNARIVKLPVGVDGIVRVEALADDVLHGAHPIGKALVSLQMANNETGVIQPVAETAAFARAHGISVHSDAVQAAGRLEIDVEALGVDYLTISAHKLGGPKGVGALVLRNGAAARPLLVGGGQERRRRAGTENIAAIAGFSAAACEAQVEFGTVNRQSQLIRELEVALLLQTPEAVVIGREVPRLANTTCIALPGKTAEILVIRLDLAGIAVSAGSACSSGKVGASHVLAAMNLPVETTRGAIRVSIGPSTTETDIGAFLAAWNIITRSAALAA
jgi:cysteine desulfurase